MCGPFLLISLSNPPDIDEGISQTAFRAMLAAAVCTMLQSSFFSSSLFATMIDLLIYQPCYYHYSDKWITAVRESGDQRAVVVRIVITFTHQ